MTLSFGLAGLGVIRSLSDSISGFFEGKNKEAMGADITISTRRPLTETEEQSLLKALPAGSQVSSQKSVFSMISTSSGAAKLANIMGVDGRFPLVGTWTLRTKNGTGLIAGDQRPSSSGVWIYEDLEKLFELKIGDFLGVGLTRLQIEGVIQKDPSLINLDLRFLPQMIVQQSSLERAQLLIEGSLVRYKIDSFA